MHFHSVSIHNKKYVGIIKTTFIGTHCTWRNIIMTMQCKSDMVNVTMQRETQYCITMNSNNIYNMHGTDI